MRVDDRLGTWAGLRAAAAPELRPVLDALRDMIAGLHPDALETARLKEGAVSYGFGPKKMSEAHCYLFPHKAHVNLGFYHGAALPDPEGRLEGNGKGLRHVKVKSLAEAADPALAALVAAAMTERREALDL